MGLSALENGLAGLQSNSTLMDTLGVRISSALEVPFSEVMNQESALPANVQGVAGREGIQYGEVGPGSLEGTAGSPDSDLLPGGLFYSLDVDLASEMVQMLIAKAAFAINARVVAAASHSLKVLTQLGVGSGS